jgi:amidophosphoribosyltransferase
MCGVVGIWAGGRGASRLAYLALLALQHRGEESAGIAVSHQSTLARRQGLGLVTQALDESEIRSLVGEAAIGHTRYSTTGAPRLENAQPIVHCGPARAVALAHNGNLVGASRLRASLRDRGVALSSSSDTEIIAALLAATDLPLREALGTVIAELDGAFSCVALTEGRLVAFRDPYGFRPLVLGRLGDGGWVVASESAALAALGARLEREVAPGELVVGAEEGFRAEQVVPPKPSGAFCIFEYFYLARPDSLLEGEEVYGTRVRMGERLALEAPVEADVVIPVPDSGTPAALGYARQMGLPLELGLVKNRYVGRSFIQPDRETREHAVRLKFTPLGSLHGKRVVVVDDSIVRGSTIRHVVRMLLGVGAAEVHVRIASPPVRERCYYGVDLADVEELLAHGREVEEVRELIGSTSLAYLSVDGLRAATRRPARKVCCACLTGKYPTAVPDEGGKLRFEAVASNRRREAVAV